MCLCVSQVCKLFSPIFPRNIIDEKNDFQFQPARNESREREKLIKIIGNVEAISQFHSSSLGLITRN
jgi:hypothetical protein